MKYLKHILQRSFKSFGNNSLKYVVSIILLANPILMFCQVNEWVQRNDIGTSIKNGPPYGFGAPTFWFSMGNKGYIGIITDTSNITFMFEFDATTNNWTPKASFPGKSRYSPFNFSIGGKGYVGGGWNYPNYYNDFWEYDPATDSWTRKVDLPLVLYHCAGFSIGDKGYIVLGYNVTSSTNSNDLWEFDPIQNLWTMKGNFPGVGRDDEVAFSINSNGYVGLGYHLNNNNQPIFDNDIWEYNPGADAWTSKKDYPGVNRFARIGIGFNGNGYVGTGGQPYNFPESSNEFWEFDPVANSWNQKKFFFDDARTGATSFVINNQLYVGFGQGRIGNPTSASAEVAQTNDLWVYDEINDNWSEKRALQYDYARCSFKIGGTGYILVNKYNFQIGKSQLALFAYDMLTKVWNRKADFPSTQILWSMGAFTLGDKAYVVCGDDSDLTASYKDTYEYDASLDKWTRKADFGGAGRGNMSTFSINGKGYAGLGWVRTSVGGISSAYKVNDFWEYDPQSDLWSRKADIPSSNNEVSFFNTESNAYVINGSMQLFEFDPTVNIWTQKNDFPGTPRTNALGMNIGNEGYVFGGTDNVPVNGYYVYLKDLWKYNPVNDTWTVTNDFPGHERATGIGFSIGDKLFIGSGFNQTMHLYDWWEYQADEVLSLALINFYGNINNSNEILLNWQTAQEINTSHFIVERSVNGIDFNTLGKVNASGNSSILKYYSYVDQKPLAGTDFYRLKMIDADGKFTYSKVVAIKMDSKNVRLQIFPNPARNILNIQVNGYNENALLQIIDMTGQKVKEEKISLNGTTSVAVDLNALPKGTYSVLLKGVSINEHQKFVKQ